MNLQRVLIGLLALWAAGCAVPVESEELPADLPTEPVQVSVTPIPTRGPHPPGELQAYTAQTGDTLIALAAHFNTSVEAILQENPGIPTDVTTLPPGFSLQIPAYYLPLHGTAFKILPDSRLVNGPEAVGFDLRKEIMGRPGFLAEISDYAYQLERPAWGVIEAISLNYSIDPRLLLALLEYQSRALTDPFPQPLLERYPLGYENSRYQGLFRQLLWAAEELSDAYYGWRTGELREFETAEGLIFRPDPWQNAATVALQQLFTNLYRGEEFEAVVSPEGFQQTYRDLWGDPFKTAEPHIPAQLQQPELALPFEPGHIWDFTGGPHFSWGTSLPLGALDFAPPAVQGGCTPSSEWVAAPAPGVITRSESALVVLDLDGDGDERTGWILFFYHMADRDRIAAGVEVQIGDPLGHPSCEGGRSTGTHFHVARRYNGEWIPAAGVIPFELDGWVASAGAEIYQGTLTKGSKVVEACTCTTLNNRILYEPPE